jgi:hypothetical protein
MRQKKTPVHFLSCNAAMQSLAAMLCHMESVQFQATLMLPGGSPTQDPMVQQIVELSEVLGGSHVDLDKVVELWDAVKESYYSNMEPSDSELPKAMDILFGAADDAISMVLNFMER